MKRLTLEGLRARIRQMRYQQWMVVAASLLILFDLFVKPLDVISVGLVVIIVFLLSPLREAMPRFVKSAEVPGWFKIEFREKLQTVAEEAKDAGLLSEPPPEQKERPIEQLIYNDDPTLSLAGLRIAIEKRLRDLAKLARIDSVQPLPSLVRALRSSNKLTAEEASALDHLIPLLNRAIHALDVDKEMADWVIKIGPKLIAGLDQKAIAAGGTQEGLWGNTAPTGYIAVRLGNPPPIDVSS
jgi:hypothetical protein